MRKKWIIPVIIIVVIIVVAGLYYKNVQARKAEQARIEERKRIDEEKRVAEQKRIHDEYEAIFIKTAGTVYVESVVCTLICSTISQFWEIATKYSSVYSINEAIDNAKKALNKVALYEHVNKNKNEIDNEMRKLITPPEDFKNGYNFLMDMYGYYVQLYNQASSPSGSYISFNRDVNEKFSEVQKSYEKIKVVIPSVQEEVEKQKKKLEIEKKIKT